MDRERMREAFDDVFDQAVVFHGFAGHMRDYDVYVYATAAPSSGITPEHLRYQFTHCVRATVTTTLGGGAWRQSLGDELTDLDEWERSGEPDGYLWGVRWHNLYPGMQLQPDSEETRRWSETVGIPFHEVLIQTNAHRITLVFSDLRVTPVDDGTWPFRVEG